MRCGKKTVDARFLGREFNPACNERIQLTHMHMSIEDLWFQGFVDMVRP